MNRLVASASGELLVQMTTRRLSVMLWAVRLNWVGLLISLVEVGYWVLSDTDLDIWLKRCVFRKEKVKVWAGKGQYKTKVKSYDNPDQEIKALFQALGFGEPPKELLAPEAANLGL